MSARTYWIAATMIIVSGFLTGCASLTSLKEPYRKIDYYTLQYDTPAPPVSKKEAAVLLIQTFRISAVFNTTKIVFSDAPYSQDTYHYHRWYANPAEIVTYFLARDIRASGLVKAVFLDDSKVNPTHVLSGTVDEFFVRERPSGWQAVLGMSITLVDAAEQDVSRRILFHKTYRAETSCGDKTASAVAASMSDGMQAVSTALIKDLVEKL